MPTLIMQPSLQKRPPKRKKSNLEEAKKGEAEDVLKKLLASGMTAEEILAKLQ